MRLHGLSFASWLGCAGALALATAASAPRPDLRGRVVTVDDRPVAGAVVQLYTAAPRVGTSTLCPSCYPDCRKSATAARDGNFRVRDVSDSLVFRVLVCAPGFLPLFVDSVIPEAEPLRVRLERRDLSRVDMSRAVRGRVLDRTGRPVAGAAVSPVGFKKGEMMGFGSRSGADPMSITDQSGEFLLATTESGAVWFLHVKGRDFAPQAFHDVPGGNADVALTVSPGSLLRGQVRHRGIPRGGVVVGLTSLQILAGNLSVQEEIATDENGFFTFLNVPPQQALAVYGKMPSLSPDALSPHPFMSAPDDSLMDVGQLEIGPGHELSGRVVLTDGRPLPPKTRLTLGRSTARGDNLQVPLQGDGSFHVRGIPSEAVELSLRVPGYRLSPRTPGYGGYAGVTLGMDRDLHGLTIQLEPDGLSPPP